MAKKKPNGHDLAAEDEIEKIDHWLVKPKIKIDEIRKTCIAGGHSKQLDPVFADKRGRLWIDRPKALVRYELSAEA